MNGEEMRKRWRGLSDEIISGMAEWRQRHPTATFREIAAEVDQRLSVLRGRMLSDAAMGSAFGGWAGGSREAFCPVCGSRLEQNGKKKRKLQTRGGQEVELEREYGVCPKCGQGIFPPG